MSKAEYNIGIAGISTMGASLALDIADHGYSVAAYDTNQIALGALQMDTKGRSIEATNSLAEFVSLLDVPRNVMILVPAGPQEDRLINALLPHLTSGDLIIDAANPYFKDTDARAKVLAERGIELLGVGISGGERGVSIMPGGPRHAYDRVRPVFESIAAEVNGEPCVAYLGPRSAGHYVEMVHDGIEHGVMQLIAETYDLMSRGLGMSDVAIQEVYALWNVSEVSSHLLETIAGRLRDNNGGIGATLLELVFEEAKQNGSGRWASLEARDLDVPTPTIDIAVAMQMLSGLEEGRMALRRLLSRRPIHYSGKPGILIEKIRRALCAGMIVTFAQGMALLRVASEVYAYDLALEDVARIWRGGAIRSQMLQEIYEAFYVQPHLPNLLSDWQFALQLQSRRDDLRAVVRLAVEEAIPVPAINASLAYDVHASVLMQCSSVGHQALKTVRNSAQVIRRLN
jgi:6-phosphogluconate dehydrogenase